VHNDVPPTQALIKVGSINFREDMIDHQLAIEIAIQPFFPTGSIYYSELRCFFYTGDCLAAILLALLAGSIGYASRRRSSAGPVEGPG
jgi:hypothetical protein